MIKEKDGKKYLVLGDKAIPFDRTDANGKPIIDVESETKINAKGGKDTIIKVHCLKVAGDIKLNQ